jgi:hypothetical protein
MRAGTTIASAGRPLFRIHHKSRDPVWFCDCGECRFDPPEGGCCYTSTSMVGAFIEKFGRIRVLTESFLAQYDMAVLYPTSDLLLLDLTDRHNLGLHSLTAEMHATLDYRQTQRLAEWAIRKSFAGILYSARHDLSSSLRSVALFSEKAGMGSSALIQEQSFDIPSYVIAEVENEFSISVLADDRTICEDDHSLSDDREWDLSDGPE